MRFRDVSDYARLRRWTTNPWEIVRFRNRQQSGEVLDVRFRSSAPIFLRGGVHDYHMFDRIFLRDEYRLQSASSGAHVPWECVVDLGGNVGVFTARVASLAKRVVTYEPVQMNYERLLGNTRQLENVTAVRAAVAGKAGSLRIYHPAEESRSGTFTSHTELLGPETEHYDEVRALTLDDLFREHEIARCDLLKIDVEGAEYEILHGASAGTLKRVARIHGEYHDVDSTDARTRIANFRDFITSQGFAMVVAPHTTKPNHGMFFAQRP